VYTMNLIFLKLTENLKKLSNYNNGK
jgi:hypothetical protein